MTNEVWVSVCGVHVADGEPETIRTVLPGRYGFRHGSHYVLYEEPAAHAGKTVKNRIKISGGASPKARCKEAALPEKTSDKTVSDGGIWRAEVVKAGADRVRMEFVPGEKRRTEYPTPYGALSVAMATRAVCVEDTEACLRAQIVYDLEIGGQPVSACTLTVEVTPRRQSRTDV